MIGRFIMFCLNLVLLSGMHLSCCNDTGFISMILLNKSFDRAFAMITVNSAYSPAEATDGQGWKTKKERH